MARSENFAIAAATSAPAWNLSLVIINNWGPCPGSGCNDVSGISLQDAENCMDAASLEYEPYSDDWNYFVEKCVDGLRAAGLIE